MNKKEKEQEQKRKILKIRREFNKGPNYSFEHKTGYDLSPEHPHKELFEKFL